MTFCEKCGAAVEDDVKFCPSCGAKTGAQNGRSGQASGQKTNFGATFSGLNNTADATEQFSEFDIQNNKVTAVFAYLGILVLVPLFASKDSRFARYHANQGLVLAITEFIYGFIYSILSVALIFIPVVGWLITLALGLVSFVLLAFAIFGIVNAAKGRAKELPLIGKIKILK